MNVDGLEIHSRHLIAVQFIINSLFTSTLQWLVTHFKEVDCVVVFHPRINFKSKIGLVTRNAQKNRHPQTFSGYRVVAIIM